jgi:glutamate/tyrosine decarboxylase-like PLP-dependent enzyme
MAEVVEQTCAHAQRFAAGLKAAGFDILNDVVLNQVLVSFGDAEKTTRVVARLQADGTCWCGSTVWQGKTAMRISVSSWVTTEEDVEQSLAAMLRAAEEPSG